MTARMYQLSSSVDAKQQAYIDGLKGQARVVYSALEELCEQPRLAVDINAVSGPNLKTRQDTLRVTLYYIIIFKGKGIVRAVEPAPAPEPTVEELEETVAAS